MHLCGARLSWCGASPAAHHAFSSVGRLLLFERVAEAAYMAAGAQDNGAHHPGLARKTRYTAARQSRGDDNGGRAADAGYSLQQH